MYQRHDCECRPGFNPWYWQKISNGKKWWELRFPILPLPISIFKVSFWASLSSQKNPMGNPTESQSRSIREQKSLRVNLEKNSVQQKKRSCSSCKSRQKLSAVAVGERWEEEKKEERGGGIIQIIN